MSENEVLNYYKISHYEPYDDSDDIIMGHKSYFTDSELSVMVYDVIDDYVHKYADEDLYDDERRMPCDIHTFDLLKRRMLLIHGLHLRYGFVKCPITSEASFEVGYLFRDDGLQSPFLHDKYKKLPIRQCKECKREDSLLFKKYGCPVKNPRTDKKKKEMKK